MTSFFYFFFAPFFFIMTLFSSAIYGVSLDRPVEQIFWLTDLHLDKKTPEEIQELYGFIAEKKPECLCLTGDISEGQGVIDFLKELQESFRVPVAFVLGNHDFYGSFIESFQEEVFQKLPNCFYLSKMDFLQVADNTALIGADNWFNLNDRDFSQCEILADDFESVFDLQSLKMSERLSFFEADAQKVISELYKKLERVRNEGISKVYIALHVPPFLAEHYFDAQLLASEPWKFYWSCAPIGAFLIDYAQKNPQMELVLLSGHTHKGGSYMPLENLISLIGEPSNCIPQGLTLWLEDSDPND